MPKAEKPSATGQSIEELRKRYEMLNEKRIKVEAQRDGALEQLEQIRKAAIDQFKTDDIDGLREKLAALTGQNEELRADYEKSLNEIEKRLEQIESETEPADAAD